MEDGDLEELLGLGAVYEDKKHLKLEVPGVSDNDTVQMVSSTTDVLSYTMKKEGKII